MNTQPEPSPDDNRNADVFDSTPLLDLTCPAIDTSALYIEWKDAIAKGVEALADGDVAVAMEKTEIASHLATKQLEHPSANLMQLGSHYWLGAVYGANGDLTASIDHFQNAAESAASLFSDQSAQYGLCLSALSNSYMAIDDFDAAKQLLTSYLPLAIDFTDDWGPFIAVLEDLAESARDLGHLYFNSGDPAAALEILERGVPLISLIDGDASAEMMRWTRDMADCHLGLQEYGVAAEQLDAALSLIDSIPLDERDPHEAVSCLASLGRALVGTDQIDRAVKINDDCLEKINLLEDADLELKTLVLHAQARLLLYQDNFTEAEKCLHECIATHLTLDEIQPQQLFDQYQDLGEAMATRGDYDGAVQQFSKLSSVVEKIYGMESDEYLSARSQLASRLGAYGATASALGVLEQLSPVAEEFFGVDSPHFASFQIRIAVYMRLNDDTDASHELSQEVLTRLDELQISAPTVRAEIHENLSFVYQEQGRSDEALEEMQEALRYRTESGEATEFDLAAGYNRLAKTLVETEAYDEAEVEFAKAEELLANAPGEDRSELINTHYFRGQLYFEQDRPLDALRSFERASLIFFEINSHNREFSSALDSMLARAAFASAEEILEAEFPDESTPDPAALLEQSIEAFDRAQLIAVDTGKEWLDYAVDDRQLRMKALELLTNIQQSDD